MKKYIVLAICCSLLFTSKGYSQQASYTSAQYAIGFSSGDMGEFISATSFRGAVLEYRAALSDNLMAGVEIGWNTFYEKKDYDSYTTGTETLSGVQYRYQNQVPMLASIDYLISSDKALKPYLGLGVGTMYTERSVDMNLYRRKITTWHFSVKPELGLLYELSYSTSIKLAAKYYYGLKTKKIESQGYFSLSAGLVFSID